MWTVLFDVSILSGVQRRWRIINDFLKIKDKNIGKHFRKREGISWIKAYGDNAGGKTDIGMNIRKTFTEENLNRSVVSNWIIIGARIVMGFI